MVRIPSFKHLQSEKMDRLMQLVVLIVAIAASSYSYSLQRNEPEIPEIAQESVNFYPTEFIEKLVDALSPEELQKFRSIIELQHRGGSPPSSKCSWYTHNGTRILAKDENASDYFIVDVKNLTSIPIVACNYTKGYQCRKVYDYKESSTRADCCVGKMEKRMLPVVSIKDYYKYRENKEYESHITMRDIYLKNGCDCIPKTLDAKALKNREKTCPRSA